MYVLGSDGNLWLETSVHGKFGQVPPPREQVDGDVILFEPLDPNTAYVLGLDGNLWLEHSVHGKFGQVPPPRERVDENVLWFKAIDGNTVYVLGSDGKLWLEHSVHGKFGQVPPPREQVDGNVADPIQVGYRETLIGDRAPNASLGWNIRRFQLAEVAQRSRLAQLMGR